MEEEGQKAKNIAKKIIKKLFVRKILIIIILICIIFTMLLPGLIYFITIDEGKYQENDESNVPYMASEYVKSVKFSEKGITFLYKDTDASTGEEVEREIGSNEMAQIIWRKLIKKKSNVQDYLYDASELEKLMNAELVTQYPKVDGNVELNGTIEFERHKRDGSIIKMKYMNEEQFRNYVNSNNVDALNYYTLDKSGNLVIAIQQKSTEQFSSNDSEVDISDISNSLSEEDKNGGTYSKTVERLTTKTVNYKTPVSKYTMPFQYLWDFLVIGGDSGFVLDLANLVDNSQIIISVYDNIKTTVTTGTTSYKKERKTETYARVSQYSDLPNEKYWVEEPIDGVECEDAEYSVDDQEYNTVSTNMQELNTTIIDITKADVWFMEYSKEYELQANQNQTAESNSSQSENSSYVEDEGSPEDSDSNPELLYNEHAVGFASEYQSEAQALENQLAAMQEREPNEILTDVEYVRINKYTHNIDINESSNTTTSTQEYVAGTPVRNPKISKKGDQVNFVSLLSSSRYVNVKVNIIGTEDWLFELLEEESSTANMVDLTKYLLYIVTGRNYGVTDFDFSIYDQSVFNDVSTSSSGKSLQLLKEYIRSWEGSTATTSDGTKYIIQDDGAGHPTVGHGIDIENSGYKQRFIENGYPTTLGGEVDVDFVDAIEDEIINNMLESVKSMTAGLNLTGYQINALVSRAFNCGAGGAITVERNGYDFESAYNAFWNSETDDKFSSGETEGDFTHKLYTQYMSKPDTSGGKVLAGLERRRKSEWTLFQTGYYDTLGVRHSGVSDGGILAAADEVHQEEITWTYYSSTGDLYWNDIEQSMNNPHKATCCATYVSCVIYRAGYFSESEMNTFNYNECGSLYTFLVSAGWTEIKSYDELEAGDIVFMNYNNGGKAYDHVQIYAGEDTWYNAGDTDAIQKASPYSQGSWARSNFYVALRAN